MLPAAMGVLGVNHIAFRTPDPNRLRAFYAELMGAEGLSGEHVPLRIGSTLLVFFESDEAGIPADPDELAFDVDGDGYEQVLGRARAMCVLSREPVSHTPWSRGFLVNDPDGRRLEFIHNDPSVYWQED
jgi:catechol 2,3-dioxygenase-like lactoylglutathione lyase family enzyme